MNLKNNKRLIPILAGIIALLIVVNISLLYQPKPVQTNLNMKGTVNIKILSANGTVLSQTKNDTINTNTYDYIVCMLFNSPEGCTAALGYGMIFTRLTTVTTTATLPLASNNPVPAFVMTGIGLSSGVVTTSGCANLLTANGLAAGTATESHTVNTNVVSLTESWTFTGASQAIQSVCLFPVIVAAIAGVPSQVLTTSLSFAWETFSSQTLTTGQSIGVTWTFSF